jgi:drug/metabolite transporter (DMT)-like permease
VAAVAFGRTESVLANFVSWQNDREELSFGPMSDHTRSSTLRPFLILMFGTLCISFAAIFVKMLDPRQVGPTAIGFWRTLFGSAILFIWSAIESGRVTLPKRVYLWAVLAGFLFFCDLFCWHRCIYACGAGMATILAGTQVFGSAVLGYFVFREKLSLKFMVAAVSAFLGVCLLIGVGSETVKFTPDYLLGIVLGLLTGIAYANYIVTLKKVSAKQAELGTITLMAWTSLFTCIFMGSAAVIESEPIMPPNARSYILLFALGLIPQALGWRAITNALPKLDAARAALGLLLQPLLGTIWGMIIFSEHLTVIQMLGAAITLAAIYLGSVRK